MTRTIILNYSQMWLIMDQSRLYHQRWGDYVRDKYHGRLVFVGESDLDNPDSDHRELGQCASGYAIEFYSDRQALEYLLRYS